jgi:hypothetical protein
MQWGPGLVLRPNFEASRPQAQPQSPSGIFAIVRHPRRSWIAEGHTVSGVILFDGYATIVVSARRSFRTLQ